MELKWLTSEMEYEEIPLYLRKPVYQDIWAYQKTYTQLVCISHSLDSVNSNGLPTPDYNESLIDFDGEVVDLFNDKEGIIFLVETYGGSRNYWFYTSPLADYTAKFNNLQEQHKDKTLEVTARVDSNWEFINDYPFRLYEE